MRKILFLMFLLIFPLEVFANSFNGLGILVMFLFAGIPSAVLLLILFIITLVVKKSQKMLFQSKIRFKNISLVFACLIFISFPASAFVIEQNYFFEDVSLILFLWSPTLLFMILYLLTVLKIGKETA